jgi:hypothetical protein
MTPTTDTVVTMDACVLAALIVAVVAWWAGRR